MPHTDTVAAIVMKQLLDKSIGLSPLNHTEPAAFAAASTSIFRSALEM